MRSFFSPLLFASSTLAKIYYAGVAESGGEFGVYSATADVGFGLPGTFNVDYAFIDKSTVDVFVDEQGVNLFRIAFLLERLCPLEYGLGSKFNETHFDFLKDAVDYVTVTKGAYAILDPHNYMRYNDPRQQPMSGSIIGDTSDSTAATTQQFQDMWQELASRFANNTHVIYGIMNEPHDMESSLLLENDQAAIDGIRASGARSLIIAPGNAWTGGHSWLQNYTGNNPASGYFMQNLRDPLNNTAMDVHEYLDTDFSGGHSVCNQSFPENMAPLTSWLKANNLKAMVTEFGGTNNTQCGTYLQDALNYMSTNDQYIGWTAWAAGPLWNVNSPCCTDSAQLGSLEPGSTAVDGGPGLYETVWLKYILPLLPKDLLRNGTASVVGG